jgi:predicted ribosome-associated RNA-binding protein Tma20
MWVKGTIAITTGGHNNLRNLQSKVIMVTLCLVTRSDHGLHRVALELGAMKQIIKGIQSSFMRKERLGVREY